MATISTLEILPDELIINIVQYLRSVDILYSLFNLNTRLNMAITGCYHYLNLNNVTRRQFDCILSKISPEIGSHIQSFVVNGTWASFISKNFNLSSIFPNLHTLILEYFTSQQLCTFIDEIKGLLQLVKMNMKCIVDKRSANELLQEVLAVNNKRLRSVSFDHNSIFLILDTIDKTMLYPNIEELTLNLIDCDMLGDLFKIIPNIRRLHINLGVSPEVSLITLQNAPSLIHLRDFQLRSINMVWTFEDICNILLKMPSLQKLALYLYTEDIRLVNEHDLAIILPLSLSNLHFFILYGFTGSRTEVDTLLNTWPLGRISISYLLNERFQVAIIHTLPFNMSSIMIPEGISKYILPGLKCMEKVKNLSIYGDSSYINLLMIIQNFHQLRTLKIDLRTNSEAYVMTESTQGIVLHLSQLKQLRIKGVCELFDLIEAAPNIDDLSIDFDCYKKMIDEKPICQLLEKRIVRLEIFRLPNNHMIQLDVIVRQFTNLRHMIFHAKDSTNFVDSLLLQALNMWRKEGFIYLCLKGCLSRDACQNLCQWFIDHSHLGIENSFAIDYRNEWIHLWF